MKLKGRLTKMFSSLLVLSMISGLNVSFFTSTAYAASEEPVEATGRFGANKNDYEIPIRDTYVMTYEGKYYLYGTEGKTAFSGSDYGFEVYVSDDLETWDGPYIAFPKKGWDGSLWADATYWAPEVYEVNGSFYMFASWAQGSGMGSGRHVCVLKADNPLGPFQVWNDKLISGGNDSTLYIQKNKTTQKDEYYLVHNGNDGTTSEGMFITKLTDDLKNAVGSTMRVFGVDSTGADGVGFDTTGNLLEGWETYTTSTGRVIVMYAINAVARGAGSSVWGGYYGSGLVYFDEGIIDDDGNPTTNYTFQNEIFAPLNCGHNNFFDALDGSLKMGVHFPNQVTGKFGPYIMEGDYGYPYFFDVSYDAVKDTLIVDREPFYELFGDDYYNQQAANCVPVGYVDPKPGTVSVSANEKTPAGGKAEYTFRSDNMVYTNLIDITFTVDGNIVIESVTNPAMGLNGFEIFKVGGEEIQWTDLGNSQWQGRIILEAYSGTTITGSMDVCKLTFDTLKLGDAKLTMTAAKVYGIDDIAYKTPRTTERIVTLNPASATVTVTLVIVPTVKNAVISGTSLILAFDKPLANKEADKDAFTVSGVTAGNSIASVTVSGSALTLTLDSPAAMTDTVTISYQPTGSNDLTDGVSYVAAFSDYPVTNITGCGSDGVVVAVIVSPLATDIDKGGSEQFTAEVIIIGDAGQEVEWSVTGGASPDTIITSSGLLTIGSDETASSLIVRADSTFDSEKFDTAIVTVIDPDADTYILTVSAGEGGTAGIVGGSTEGKYKPGDRVSVTATPNSRYKFVSWTSSVGGGFDNASNAAAIFTMPDEDVTVTASFSYTGGTGSGGGGGTSTYGARPASGAAKTSKPKESEVEAEPYIEPTVTELPKPVAVLDKTGLIAYISGYPDGTIRPEGNITRAEAAVIFYKLVTDSNKSDYIHEAGKFSDISEGQWYSEAVGYLAAAGIISGYGDGSFKPDNEITRAEFAAMASGFSEMNLNGNLPFNDVGSEHWAVSYIRSMYNNGWVSGYPDGSFKPDNKITRAEVIVIVNKMTLRDTLLERPGVPPFTDLSEDKWYYNDVMAASSSKQK